MSNAKYKIIYSLQIHIKLQALGFTYVTEMKNPKNPKFNCWVYEETEEVFNTKEFDSYKGKGISGFRLRFMIALILFLSFFYFDKNQTKIGNIDSGQIESFMEDDSLQCLVSNMFDFNG